MKLPTWFYIVVFGCMAALAIASCASILYADHDHDEVRCFVQYAPDKVADFSDLWTIKHRDGSKMVGYLMDDGNTINERYENADQAERWIRRVYRQLRQCN